MPTVFDELYEQLFKHKCTREGEAFERLSAAVTALVFPDADVAHNKKLRGQLSKSLYQIDVLRKDAGETVFGEAKDYTGRSKSGKVGRDDLQKLGGALPDVAASRGVFYSATDYTREARRYANAANQIVGRPIDLMHVVPSVDLDKNGRISKIMLSLTVRTPDLENAKWAPALSPAGEATLMQLREESGLDELRITVGIDRFFDSTGAETLTLHDLTADGYGDDVLDDEAHGCFWLPGSFVKVGGRLVEIRGVEYLIPYTTEGYTIEIESTGNPKILVKSDDGTVNKLITDKQLQKLEFDGEGNVRRNSRTQR